MTVLRFKHFTRPQLLQRIGRQLLTEFLERFRGEFLEHNLAVPPPHATDADWLAAVLALVSAPDALPASFAEALYAIDEMSSPQGQEQLELAVDRAGLSFSPGEGSTREDIAMQVWLAAPALLARLHNQQRLRRLTAFQYFCSSEPPALRLPFAPPTVDLLRKLEAALDPWFACHQRGHNTCRIELYKVDAAPPGSAPAPTATAATLTGHPGDHSKGRSLSEYWFLVRHGDTFTRTPKVDAQKTEIIHFRPQRDDVVVYNSIADEIRVNCRTKGECDLYVRSFGRVLRGNEQYFSARDAYTLEPLRTDGADALQTEGVPELDKAVLRGLEVSSENGRYVVTHTGEDLFGHPARQAAGAIPESARLRCATFDLHFTGCRRPRPVCIRPPNFLKVGRHCDVHVVDRFLRRGGFRR